MLGSDYLGAFEKPEVAAVILKANISFYPKSANTYDSYREALMNFDKNEEAIKNYTKSLELDPNNGNAKDYDRTIERELIISQSSTPQAKIYL